MTDALSDDTRDLGSPVAGTLLVLVAIAVGIAAVVTGGFWLAVSANAGVLVLGVIGVSTYRFQLMRRTLGHGGRVISRRQRRWALFLVLLVLLASTANAFVWASEVAKR